MKIVRIGLTCITLVCATPLMAAAPAGEQRIKELITQLGDADFKQRQAASAELKLIGKPALPALKAAENHDDPEVRGRVSELLQALEASAASPDPGARARRAQRIIQLGGGNAAGMVMEVRAGGGNAGAQMEFEMKTAFEKNGTKYEVSRSSQNGVGKLEVRIKEIDKDGKEVERRVEAADDEALAKTDAELARLVAENAAAAPAKAVQVQFGGQVIVDNGMAVVAAPPELVVRMIGNMGLKVGEEEKGVRLAAVEADSQAAKLGLQEGDLLTSINGQAITSSKDALLALRKVKETDPLSIEILRGAKTMTLKRP